MTKQSHTPFLLLCPLAQDHFHKEVWKCYLTGWRYSDHIQDHIKDFLCLKCVLKSESPFLFNTHTFSPCLGYSGCSSKIPKFYPFASLFISMRRTTAVWIQREGDHCYIITLSLLHKDFSPLWPASARCVCRLVSFTPVVASQRVAKKSVCGTMCKGC